MKKTTKIAVVSALALTVAAVPALSFAMPNGQMGPMGGQNAPMGEAPQNQTEISMDESAFGGRGGHMGGREMMGQPGQMNGQNQMGGQGQMGQPGEMNGQNQMGPQGMMNGQQATATEAGEIAYSDLASNSAEELTADYTNATTITVSEDNNIVKIKASGTYIITGSASDGYIQVNKGVQDVLLILKDLTLTSTSQATLSINKGAEAKIIVQGNVTLTDAETDTESDDYDGAVIKAKAGSSTVLSGTGTLTLNGNSNNGIKVSDTDADDVNDGYSDASFIIDGSLTINVTAANDGMNSGTDLTIKNGKINVSAGDDGIKADYILTIGEEGTSGPTINVSKSTEALEGATVNILSGNITVTASDDGINAANSDLTGYTYSLNVLGGTTTVSSGADGLDSNGNINLISGKLTIAKSASNGGEGGIDYEGSYYISDDFELVNPYGITMDSGMGQMGGQGRMNGQQSENAQMNRGNGQAAQGETAPDANTNNNKGGIFQRIMNFFRK